jgi:hypothetical protein
MIICRWILLRIINVTDRSCREKNTCFVFKNFYFSTIVPLMSYCGKIWYNLTDHNWQYGTRALHAGYQSIETLSANVILFNLFIFVRQTQPLCFNYLKVRLSISYDYVFRSFFDHPQVYQSYNLYILAVQRSIYLTNGIPLVFTIH